jgi:hypothetical protein
MKYSLPSILPSAAAFESRTWFLAALQMAGEPTVKRVASPAVRAEAVDLLRKRVKTIRR